MQLHELRRGAKFKLVDDPATARRPPGDGFELKSGEVFTTRGLDGMYCPCTVSDGRTAYFAAWTEVEQVQENT